MNLALFKHQVSSSWANGDYSTECASLFLMTLVIEIDILIIVHIIATSIPKHA